MCLMQCGDYGGKEEEEDLITFALFGTSLVEAHYVICLPFLGFMAHIHYSDVQRGESGLPSGFDNSLLMTDF